MLKLPSLFLAILIAGQAWADEPQAANARPQTLDGAVFLIVGKLNANQKQIILSATKETLLLTLAEWAEDVQDDLGLQRGGSGNSKLIADVCKRPCTADQATALILAAVWDAIQK